MALNYLRILEAYWVLVKVQYRRAEVLLALLHNLICRWAIVGGWNVIEWGHFGYDELIFFLKSVFRMAIGYLLGEVARPWPEISER